VVHTQTESVFFNVNVFKADFQHVANRLTRRHSQY